MIIEKPFGVDLETARALNRQVHEILDERQIYRIDHYLGKETVQNILVFRFANGIFEPMWNNHYIDHVQITGSETVGVEGRGGYFEQAGGLRDMVQNHLLQVLSLVAMEPPVAFEADGVRDEKLKVLKALRHIPQPISSGRSCAPSTPPARSPAARCRRIAAEPGVDPASTTETFVGAEALHRLVALGGRAVLPALGQAAAEAGHRDRHRVQGGAALLFGNKGGPRPIRPNVLSIRIQPDEGIALNFGSKLPGPAMEIAPVSMEFRYGSSFGVEPPEAYERLLLDCLLGDSTLFTRADEVEASWSWVSRIHQRWAGRRRPATSTLPGYAAGSWGPQESDRMLAADGRAWRLP